MHCGLQDNVADFRKCEFATKATPFWQAVRKRVRQAVPREQQSGIMTPAMVPVSPRAEAVIVGGRSGSAERSERKLPVADSRRMSAY